MSLSHLQERLQGIYELELNHCVNDFLVTNRDFPDSGMFSSINSRESLLVHQDEEVLNLSLYLHYGIVENLKMDGLNLHLHQGNIEDFCLALEGISHFVYLIWNATYRRSVTKLEMEIQAEIDKFIMLSRFMNRRDVQLYPGQLRRLLFESVRFREGLKEEDTQRYRDANYFAGKYCWFLESRRYLHPGLEQELLKEIRRFYRFNLKGKLNRINYLH